MWDLISFVPWWVWLVLLIVVIIGGVGAVAAPQVPNYGGRKYFFTKSEWFFYRRLTQAVQGRYLVVGKARIADVLYVRKGKSRKAWWRAFTQISSKHVDYVLLSPQNGEIVACIELDDASHRRKDRQQRDRFVNQAFAGAGIPLLRVPTNKDYDPEAIAQALDRATAPQN